MPQANIVPTRSELIKLRKRIALSKTGHKLLKMKRDGLMNEFFLVLPRVKEVHQRLFEKYAECMTLLAQTYAVEGKAAVMALALSQGESPEFELGKKNIMGVEVPTVKGKGVRRSVHQRGYGMLSTTGRLDETVGAFEELTDLILQAAEVEMTLKRLLEEIEKTKRRVNALEFRIIPELEAARTYITLRLEEIERDNIFRLKMIKGKSSA